VCDIHREREEREREGEKGRGGRERERGIDSKPRTCPLSCIKSLLLVVGLFKKKRPTTRERDRLKATHRMTHMNPPPHMTHMYPPPHMTHM
jgi:hypothetical protein